LRRHGRSSRPPAGPSGNYTATAVTVATAQPLLRPESRHRFPGASSSPPSSPSRTQVSDKFHRGRAVGQRAKRRVRHDRTAGPAGP